MHYGQFILAIKVARTIEELSALSAEILTDKDLSGEDKVLLIGLLEQKKKEVMGDAKL